MHRQRRRITLFAALAAAFLVLSGLVAGFTPRASAHGDEAAAHPAHIHVGTCAAPGEVVFPLSNVGSTYDMDGTPAAGEWTGPETALAVDGSVTTVAASLSDIVSGGHAIVVHESAENIANYIACGDIGGMMLGDMLPVGLAPLNDSGYSGVALLQDGGDGTTTVTVFLTEGKGADMGHDMGTPAAMAGDEVQATIENFAFAPGMIEIPAGTTVTWTNMDSAPHTVSQTGGGFESGKLDQGQTFSFTFDTPGTYEYFCQYHPNMTGTIVVS